MSKLGVHVVTGSRSGYGNFLRRIASAGQVLAIVKCVDAFDAAREAKGYMPDTLTVGRINTTMDANGKSISLQAIEPVRQDGTYEQARDVAARYYELVRPIWLAHRSWIDVWETFNEFSAYWAWQSDFYLAMMDLAEADGFRLAHYACSTGNPPNVSAAMQMLPCLRQAKRRGHFLSLHEYGGVGTKSTTLKGTEPYHALRYRHLYESILVPNQADPPLLITECGPNGGHLFPGTQALMEDLKWYDAELCRDSYVLGALVFTLGNWAGANFEAALPDLAEHISSGISPPPDRPVLAEPYVFGKPPILDLAQPPPSWPARGSPRTQYKRIYLLLPHEPNSPEGDSQARRWVQALVDSGVLIKHRLTLGFSADDAGIGDLDHRHIVAINPDSWPSSLSAFFANHYPGVDFNAIAVQTPEALLELIRRRFA